MPLNKSSKLWWFVDSISTSQIELYLDAERSSASSCVLKTVGRRKTRRLVLTCCFPLALKRLPNRGMSPTKGTRLFEILMSSWIRPPSTMVCRSSAKIVVSIVLLEVTTSANALPPTGVLMTLVICWATSSRTSEPLCTCGVTVSSTPTSSLWTVLNGLLVPSPVVVKEPGQTGVNKARSIPLSLGLGSSIDLAILT